MRDAWWPRWRVPAVRGGRGAVVAAAATATKMPKMPKMPKVPIPGEMGTLVGGGRPGSGQPAARLQGLPAEQAELDLVGRAGVLRVVLEAGALEVLDGVGPAVGGVDLAELLGQRQAEEGQPAVGLPVGAEAAAERMLRLGEVAAIARRRPWGDRPERRRAGRARPTSAGGGLWRTRSRGPSWISPMPGA